MAGATPLPDGSLDAEPYFPFVGGETFWPLTGSVGFFRASLRRVGSKVRPASNSRNTVRQEFESLAAALTGVAGDFSFENDRVTFIVGTRDPGWTAVLVSTFPHTDIAGYMAARARMDVGCDFVAFSWVPTSSPKVPPIDRILGGGLFLDYRHERRLFGQLSGPGNRRTIQVSNQGSSWDFDISGPQRDFEEPEFYARPRKAERLPRELLSRYLQAVGLPVTQPEWLSGPAVVSVEVGRGLKRRGWRSIVELRRMCGYPEAEVPERLTGWWGRGG